MIREIAPGKGILGIPYKFDNPKTKRKSKFLHHFLNTCVDKLK
jgi:hypothetical protein